MKPAPSCHVFFILHPQDTPLQMSFPLVISSWVTPGGASISRTRICQLEIHLVSSLRYLKKMVRQKSRHQQKEHRKDNMYGPQNEQQKHLENRPKRPKMKRPSSHHQFSGVFAVSFRGKPVHFTVRCNNRLPSCNLKPLHAFLRSNNASRKKTTPRKKTCSTKSSFRKKKRSSDKMCFPY